MRIDILSSFASQILYSNAPPVTALLEMEKDVR
jgi:hypothetical protein